MADDQSRPAIVKTYRFIDSRLRQMLGMIHHAESLSALVPARLIALGRARKVFTLHKVRWLDGQCDLMLQPTAEIAALYQNSREAIYECIVIRDDVVVH